MNTTNFYYLLQSQFLPVQKGPRLMTLKAPCEDSGKRYANNLA